MNDTSKERIVIVDDRLWKSLCRDAVSVISLLLMIGVGVFLDSAAMQWIAGIVWILTVIGKATQIDKKYTYTIVGARKRLDEIEAGK